MFKKILSVAAAALISLTAFCGCGEEETSKIEQVYGLALKHVDKKDLYLIYDGNYVSDEEMDVVYNYFTSFQNCDTELFRSTQLDMYLEYLEESQSTDIDAYLEGQNKSVSSALGEGFDYVEIEVTECGDRTGDNGINDIEELLDGIYESSGRETSFTKSVNEAKYIYCDITATGADGGTYNLTDQLLYIFNCEDGIYIF
ncbi:MAG: hypothetical protein IJN85_00265 [Oscillospiraceae bacterium]|nr:hypothetical protein [Oscillospiraceae bacterium]